MYDPIQRRGRRKKPLRSTKLSPYKLNTNKNEASGDSAQLICTVKICKRSIDSSFNELSNVICFVSVVITMQSRDIVDLIYWKPLAHGGLYGSMSVVLY